MMADLSRLCIHTVTTSPLPIEEAVDAYAARGVTGITVWRDALKDRKPELVARRISDAGLRVVSLCRGGFFASHDPAKRRDALADNIAAVEEAASIGAPLVVIVPGADPAQSLAESRRQIAEGLAVTAARGRELGVRLAVEPLHPMYADTRSAINTLRQANDICDLVSDDHVGVAVDVYHLWWDPELQDQIRRTGRDGRLFAFHVCDWRSPTRDILLDRELMGSGCIDIPGIRAWVEEAGFAGAVEVEIFSTEYWAWDQSRFLDAIVEAYLAHV